MSAATDGDASGGSDGSASAPGDGGQNGAALDAAPAPGELLRNSSFESGNCQTWAGNSANLSVHVPAYDGYQACRVCAQPGESTYSIFQEIPLEWLADAGASYEASFFVRLPDATSDVDASTSLFISAATFINDVTVIGGEKAVYPRAGEWTRYAFPVEYAPRAGATSLFVSIINRSADEGCFYVDRVPRRAAAALSRLASAHPARAA